MSAVPPPATVPGRIARWVLLLAFGTFFLLPLYAMLDFTTRLPNGTRTGATWQQLIDPTAMSENYPELVDGIVTSLLLTVFTVLLMLLLLLPTMIWVRLRVPKVRKIVEFISLLPLTVPEIGRAHV